MLLVANWKLNGNKLLLNNFINKLYENKKIINNKIILAPPIIYLDYLNNILLKKYNINNVYSSSQNVDLNFEGPYTGEISIYMLKEIGVSYVILGHSERRIIHKESNKNIIKKFILVKSNNLIPILCIGENNNDYINKKSLLKCINQIKEFIKYGGIKIFYNSIIAYEPIWSIGTNVNASIDHIEYIICSILKYLNKIDKNISNNIKFLYGGSVSIDNIDIFLNKYFINGLLIGKSSLDINNFLYMINKINKI
ncbi:triose-phosphate isomerase [endosymbiont of Pachyrhynchus infernalis]|uniref:triose-phosphate isomerase n=1 Tax=endosymbiont of Pachyrhynchus infernalis TaxID=1971488 RepID=UPI000DC73DCB|nr:triose-phosphate isomerase [endosymbiont of Pachyrhynchus infernalis]BBA84942.1 triosephosphate isomerase [endosymbiont of Pachyrhynchus infernalis]